MRDKDGFKISAPMLPYGCADCDFHGEGQAVGDHYVLTLHQITYKGEPVNMRQALPGGEITRERRLAAAVRANLPLPQFPILRDGFFIPKGGK